MTELLYQGHGSYRLVSDQGVTVYVDPFAGEGYDLPADLVLVSHEHGDHNQVGLVTLKPEGKILRETDFIDGAQYRTFTVGDVTVRGTEAYNKNHPKNQCVGFLIEVEGKKLYIACDTSETEQMHTMSGEQIDYAFLPIDGVYNMDTKEAAHCAELIGAKHTVPVHMAPGQLFSPQAAESFAAPNRLIVHPGEKISW